LLFGFPGVLACVLPSIADRDGFNFSRQCCLLCQQRSGLACRRCACSDGKSNNI